MPERNILLDAALSYADLAYAVFPCAAGGKAPLTEHGFRDATTDGAQIETWWTEHPDANVGLATEGLLVVDVDGEDNSWPDCQDVLPGAVSLTPRGGLHLFYRQPSGKAWGCAAGKLGLGVDTRADGGYVVVPPSVVDGKAYCWAEGMALGVPPEDLPEPPSWLVGTLDQIAARRLDRLTAPGKAEGPPQGAHAANNAAGGNSIPSGQRHATLAGLGGTMRRAGMTEPEMLAALV